MRAGYDDEQTAAGRLRAAAELASAHGSVALRRRCEKDLLSRGVRGAWLADDDVHGSE